VRRRMQISVSGDAKIEFAKVAMKWFIEHPEHTTFTEKEPDDGCLFAVRWGMGQDCVLVFTVGDEPIVYTP